MRLTLETTRIKGIPLFTLAPANAMGCPVVFFIPGYTGTKEAGFPLVYRLARRGFFVISFDPWLHGERFDDRLHHAAAPKHGGVYPPDSGLDTMRVFFHVIAQCPADVKSLLAYYAGDPRVDVTRVGVTGLSMGGCASYQVFAEVSEVRVAAPMIGIPSFARRCQDVFDECRFSEPRWAAALAQVEAQEQADMAFVAGIDPVEGLKTAAPRALLMMNCDFDSDQPKHYAIETYRELLPHYAEHPEKLQLRIYPAGHVVTPAMECDAVDWFVQHL